MKEYALQKNTNTVAANFNLLNYLKVRNYSQLIIKYVFHDCKLTTKKQHKTATLNIKRLI